MEMRAFLKERGMTQGAAAAALGISRTHMTQILNGRKVPSLALACRIERMTDGAVPMASWIAESANREDAA